MKNNNSQKTFNKIFQIILITALLMSPQFSFANHQPPPGLLYFQPAPNGMTLRQRRYAEKITSFFENSTTKFQYGYAENINDGRGITSGRAGFTTATGDAYEVVKRYTDKKADNVLAKYLPELKKLADQYSENTSNLTDYEKNWTLAASDPLFRWIQDQVVNDFYYVPAMEAANNNGIKLPLTKAIIYDTIIQHGNGDDPDGLPALIQRTNQKAGGSPKSGIDEKKWLYTFLQVRRDDLTNASDQATRDAWAESAERVDALKQLADQNNFQLMGPILISTTNLKLKIF